MRYVFLNGLPLNALPLRPLTLRVTPVDARDLKCLASDSTEKVSFIRHQATIELLKSLGIDLEVSSGLYQYQDGDVIYVVTLRRPVRGAEVEGLSLEDLLIHKVVVEK